MTDFPKESLFGVARTRVKSRLERIKSLWRELTSPVSADFIGVPHAERSDKIPDRRDLRPEKGETDFADYYRWMQL